MSAASPGARGGAGGPGRARMGSVNPSRAFLLVAAAALAAGCAGRPPAPPPKPSPAEFFPLAVGNTWTYLDRSARDGRDAHHTVRIVSRDAAGYFVDDQRGALRVEGDCLRDRIRRLLCRPIEVGSSWTSVVSGSVTERYRIAAVDETVTVPAGTFPGCVRVRSQARTAGAEQVAELTYAPGVGLVRLETFGVTGGVVEPQVRGELESFRLVAEGK